MKKNLTKDCKFCQRPFSVSYKKRKKKFCCKKCRKNKHTSLCVICNAEFENLGNKVVCSDYCNDLYVANTKLIREKEKSNFSCLHCKGSFQYPVEKDALFCSRLCWFAHNNKIEEVSNGRPPNTCLLCNTIDSNNTEHFIDRNYDNRNSSNIAILCPKCVMDVVCVNNDHTFWEIIFSALKSGSKLVRKEWGLECHCCNSNLYCLKYLVFFAGCHFSFHYHKMKQELWHCLVGNFEMLVEDELSVLKQGQKIEIMPGIAHQLKATKNSIIVEVSTQSFDQDSHKDRNLVPHE